MKINLLLIFVCMSFLGYTHETNAAYFKFTQNESTVEVTAEFPWTFRNALFDFNPLLDSTAQKETIENTFIEYIQTNLVLTNSIDQKFKFESFEEIPNTGHSHQNSYRFIFNGKDLFKVKNTVMFNLFDNQKNYNTFRVDDKEKTVKTTQDISTFELPQKQGFNLAWLAILLVPLAYFILIKKIKGN